MHTTSPGPARGSDAHVVIVGASMAGLAAAGVLAPRVGTITIVERDDLGIGRDDGAVAIDDGRSARPAIPQGRHAHALLAAGRDALERVFPGITDDVVAAGGLVVDSAANCIWYQLGGRRVCYPSSVTALGVSRWLLEQRVRARVRALSNVAVVDGAVVRSLRFAPDGSAVTGVDIEREGDFTEVHADLVVDAGGRNAPLLEQVAAAGYPSVPVDRVSIDLAYASRVVDRRPADLGGADYLVAMASPPYGRGGIVLPIEGDRWIVTLNGAHGDPPPTDPDGFEAFARTIAVPELAELIAGAPPDHAVAHRFPASQRRRLERVTRHPAGYVVVGDAVCSFNPAYGQGMSSAALQAERIGAAVDRHGLASAAMPRAAYRAITKVVDKPWRIAVGADFVHPKTTGPKPPGTDLVNRYMKVVLRACHVSPVVNEQMVRVQNLLDPPTSLMRPRLAVQAVLAARRAARADIGVRSSEGGRARDPLRTH